MEFLKKSNSQDETCYRRPAVYNRFKMCAVLLSLDNRKDMTELRDMF